MITRLYTIDMSVCEVLDLQHAVDTMVAMYAEWGSRNGENREHWKTRSAEMRDLSDKISEAKRRAPFSDLDRDRDGAFLEPTSLADERDMIELHKSLHNEKGAGQ